MPLSSTRTCVPSRHQGILVAVLLTELVLFADYHQERWRKALAPRSDPAVRRGEGLTIRCDGLGYYAWLRSALVDGDWAFDDEFDRHNPLGDYVPPVRPRTETGMRPNPWSVGPACAWAAIVAPLHTALRAFGGPGPADGYSLPYQLAVAAATLLAAAGGLLLVYAVCRRFADPEPAALAAAFLTLGTPVLYYSTVEVSMAHGVGTAAVALLVWYWLQSYGSTNRMRWFGVGLLVGLAALVRWQLAAFAILPAGEALLAAWRADRRPAARLTLTGLGAVAAFSPQMIAWRLVYGRWLVFPFPTAHNWANPSWTTVLMSQDRGLFFWTPLTAVACAGFFAVFRGRRHLRYDEAGRGRTDRGRTEALALLGAAFALQVYVLASLWGAQLYLGAAFGFRQLTETAAVLAPAMAVLLGQPGTRRFRVLTGLAGVLVVWNLTLISLYRYGWIPADAGADPGTLLTQALRLAARKRLLLLSQIALGPALLALAWWGLPGRPIAFREGRSLPARGIPSRPSSVEAT